MDLHTITSNCSGFETSCMLQLSTIISSYLIPGYLDAISRQDSKKRPSASFMMFALCTAVTFFLLLRYAHSNAYLAMRSEQNFVITQPRDEVSSKNCRLQTLRQFTFILEGRPIRKSFEKTAKKQFLVNKYNILKSSGVTYKHFKERKQNLNKIKIRSKHPIL